MVVLPWVPENCDWGIVVAHDLTKKLGSGQHWNAFFHCTGIFRVIRMNGCSVNYKFYIVCNIGSGAVRKDACTFPGKGIRKRAFFGIRAGNLEVLAEKDLSKSAHADSANTDKMDMKRFMEVYLIHVNLLMLIIFEAIQYSLKEKPSESL